MAYALHGIVTHNAHRTAAAAFYAHNNGIVGDKARIFPVEIAEALSEPFAYLAWQPFVQSGWNNARQVGA